MIMMPVSDVCICRRLLAYREKLSIHRKDQPVCNPNLLGTETLRALLCSCYFSFDFPN